MFEGHFLSKKSFYALKKSVNKKEVLKDLEKKISPVLVVNNSSLKPYVELFDYAPENIYQQPLGNLVGFFEVKEYSEDSAYVVNFLTSVLKKEYYINPKRPVAESLDSALHKVNMALSELAKHGNIQWLGKLNAAICVLEKNSTHFSVAGNAKIFLYRSKGLTEISEDLASDSLEPHPLKTFVNVSSGRLEKDDRLLITSEDIFHIFSVLELKKNFQRFEGEKFVQFLKTALSNQMEMIASIVVEINEEEVAPKKVLATKKTALTPINAFSNDAFEKTPAVAIIKQEQPAEISLENDEEESEKNEYTDHKTGHIYVQGEVPVPSENPKVALFMEEAKEKVAEAWYLTKNETRRKYNLYKKQLAKKLEQRKIEKERMAELRAEEEKRLEEERVLHELEMEEELARQREEQQILDEEAAIERQKEEALQAEIFAKEQKENELRQKAQEKELQENLARQAAEEKAKKNTVIIPEIVSSSEESHEIERQLSFKEKLERAMIDEQRKSAVIDLRAPKKEESSKFETFEEFEDEDEDEDEEDELYETLDVPIHRQPEMADLEKERKAEARKLFVQNLKKSCLEVCTKTADAGKNVYTSLQNKRKQKIKTTSASIHQTEEKAHLAPRFSKIKKSFSYFTFKQKMFTLIGLVAVFIVPLFIVHFMNAPKKPTISDLSKVVAVPEKATGSEKNMLQVSQKQTLLSRSDIVSTLITTTGPVAVSKSSVLVFANGQNKEYPIATDKGSIVKAAYMSDLSLVLLITDQNKIISFSPISLKFTDNNIDLSGKTSQNFFGTYLTYLYVLDPSANQIYRYPRADGGFGEKTSWLKTGSKISDVSDAAIDENIWTIQNNQIFKFFKGQQQSFTLEASQTPVHFDKIYTNLDATSLWVLDKQNSRLVEFSKTDGSITKQYSLDELKNTTTFTVDEKNKTAYVTTTSGMISITLQ